MATDPDREREDAAGEAHETAVLGAVECADDPSESLQFLVETALKDAGFDGEGLQTWVPTGQFESSSLVRLPRFPASIDGRDERTLTLSAVRNEQQSAQLGIIATGHVSGLTCSFGDLEGETGTIPAENLTARFVGYVPVERALSEVVWSATIEDVADEAVSGTRNPDLVGDPLLSRDAVDIPPYQTQPVWLTVEVPAGVEPGDYAGTLTVEADTHDPVTFDLRVTVEGPVLPPADEFDFHLDAWLNPDAVAQEHGVERWSADHWTLLERYFADLASRSQTAVTTTIVDNPWVKDWVNGSRRPQTASGFGSMVDWTYDGESWSFDFSVFDRYVETARDCGVGQRIHAFGFLGFRPPERLSYVHTGTGDRVSEEVDVGDERWAEAWTAFFDAFVPHLEERGWLADTWLAIDEREEEIIDASVSFLEEVAPGLAERLSVAGSDDAAPYADDLSLNTVHVPELPLEYESTFFDQDDDAEDPDITIFSPEDVDGRRREGKTTTFYTAGSPTHPNMLTFSPAVESRLVPWIAAANRLDGYLNWAYASWPEDVYENPVFRYVQGAEYFVYPGQGEPRSSIRWELLMEGIEDYELLTAGRDDAGREADPHGDEARSMLEELDGRELDVTELPRVRTQIIERLTDQTNG
jgi:hypothetical protein